MVAHGSEGGKGSVLRAHDPVRVLDHPDEQRHQQARQLDAERA